VSTPATPTADKRPGFATLEGQTADTPGNSPIGAGNATLSSAELMRGRNMLAIAHNGAIYRLQTTRQGKLILTK
jgi:hemin uptake protein HemP